MQADQFSHRMIELDAEVPDVWNDADVPVMVRHLDTKAMLTIKSVDIETHDEGGATIWITVSDY